MTSLVWYVLATIGELGGCYAFWVWQRAGRGPLWAIPGMAALIGFAIALTRVEAAFAGRAFAAYGGVYIVASILWLRAVEGVAPDRWDLLGGLISLVGAAVILFAPRA